MKKIIIFLSIVYSSTVFSDQIKVPFEYLAQAPSPSSSKSLSKFESINFSRDIDRLIDLQENSFIKLSQKSEKIQLTQIQTSFSISQSGLFGLSAFSSQSSTTLLWKKKNITEKEQNMKSFELSDNDDEISLQMKIDEVTEYLVRENKVKNTQALRNNLDKAFRKGHEMFVDLQGIESQNWKVGGYRLDLSISASGNVTPFIKLGENIRLWIEWTKSSQKINSFQSDSKAGQFISNVLADIDESSSQTDLSSFELKNIFIGIGEDFKTGLFGFGASAFGFTGYVKLVRKEKHEVITTITETNNDIDYPVVFEETTQKARFTSISRKKLIKGVSKSLSFAKFFTDRASQVTSSNWELSSIRQIATISRTGFFGLSNMSTRGVFIFIFNRKKPASEKMINFNTSSTSPSLIRLSFVSLLGVTIPEIANFELRPQIELFWK